MLAHDGENMRVYCNDLKIKIKLKIKNRVLSISGTHGNDKMFRFGFYFSIFVLPPYYRTLQSKQHAYAVSLSFSSYEINAIDGGAMA